LVAKEQAALGMSTDSHRYPHLKGKRAHKKWQSSWCEKMDYSCQNLDQRCQSFCRIHNHWY
jgi:hypothetical protein